MQLPLITYKTDIEISKDLKYGPYFGDCLGALNRTHISIYVSYANVIT